VPILIVDDDEEYVHLMKMILDEEGYSVDCAYNGREAISKIQPGKYVSIITDYVMPMMRGDELAERIQIIDAKVNIILLTGYRAGIPREKINNFNIILEKPVPPDVILNALERTKKIATLAIQG
jgi:two-component system, OmpR family, response regulator VicR